MQVTEANIRDLVGAVACHPLQAMMLAPLHALVHETGQSKTAAERAIIKNIMALRKVLLMPYLGTESVQKMYVCCYYYNYGHICVYLILALLTKHSFDNYSLKNCPS